MTERTPAASVSEGSFNHWYGPSAENISTNVNASTNNFSSGTQPSGLSARNRNRNRNRQTWLRFANASLHALPCLVLLGIVACGFSKLGGDLGSHMG